MEAQQLFDESLSLQWALGDRLGMLGLLQWYSYTLANLGRIKEAERMARETVVIVQQVGGPILVGWADYSLGFALCYAGRFAEARSLMEKSLASFREWGHRTAEAWGLWSLGLTAKHLGSYEEARAATEIALTRSQEFGLRTQAANCYVELGRLELAKDAYGAAQERLQQSIAIYHEAGGMRWRASEAPAALVSRYPFIANSRWFEDVAAKHIAAVAAGLPPDVVAAAQKRGRARDLDATVWEVLVELVQEDKQ